MKPEEIAAIKALTDAATGGKWVCEPNTYAGRVWVQLGLDGDMEPLFNVRNKLHYEQRGHDAAFVAASREAVPALIKHIDELETIIARLSSIPR